MEQKRKKALEEIKKEINKGDKSFSNESANTHYLKSIAIGIKFFIEMI